MKHYIIFPSIIIALQLVSAITASAQTDIKTFENKDYDYFIETYGQPIVESTSEKESDVIWLEFSDFFVAFDFETKKLCKCYFTRADFCILSDYIDGGIKIGDSITRLKNVDFAITKYGRNKERNGLSAYQGKLYNYVIFQEEMHHIYFSIKKGIIKEIMFVAEQDCPYPKYDFSNKIW